MKVLNIYLPKKVFFFFSESKIYELGWYKDVEKLNNNSKSFNIVLEMFFQEAWK